MVRNVDICSWYLPLDCDKLASFLADSQTSEELVEGLGHGSMEILYQAPIFRTAYYTVEMLARAVQLIHRMGLPLPLASRENDSI